MRFISLRLTESPNKASALTYIVFLLPDKRCDLTARISFKTKIYFLQSLYSCFHLFLFPFQIQTNTGRSEDARVWWPALSSSSMCLAIELTDKDSYDLIWYLILTLVCDTGQSPHLENYNAIYFRNVTPCPQTALFNHSINQNPLFLCLNRGKSLPIRQHWQKHSSKAVQRQLKRLNTIASTVNNWELAERSV